MILTDIQNSQALDIFLSTTNFLLDEYEDFILSLRNGNTLTYSNLYKAILILENCKGTIEQMIALCEFIEDRKMLDKYCALTEATFNRMHELNNLSVEVIYNSIDERVFSF